MVVVGAGLAGLTAGMVAARYGLKTVIVEHMASGGQVLNVEKIENFPGFPNGIAGFELGPLVQEQAEAAGASVLMDTAESIDVDGEQRSPAVHGDEHRGEDDHRRRRLGAALDRHPRRRGVLRSRRLEVRLVRCADVRRQGRVRRRRRRLGPGRGRRAGRPRGAVTVIHRGEAFRAQRAAVDRLAEKSNIETLFNTELIEITGDGTVSPVTLREVGKQDTSEARGCRRLRLRWTRSEHRISAGRRRS